MGYPTPQPAKAAAVLRRISNRAIAAHTGRNPAWVGRILNGYESPSPEFRKAVAELLGQPEHELFRPPGPDDQWGQRLDMLRAAG